MAADCREINQYLVDCVLKCIKWAERYLKLFLLILHVKTDFSSRRTTSYVIPNLLEYDVVFSLASIMDLYLIEGKDWFYETHKRTNQFSGTETFYGDWKEHLNALVCHEVAHVFESMAKIEPYSKTIINEYYNIKPSNKRTHHHNRLWRLIYRDLRMLEDSQSNISSIVIPKEKGFDLFFNKGEYNEV